MPFHDLDRVAVDPDRARIYCEGWQSWSPTTTYRFRDDPIRPKSELNGRSGYTGTRPAAPDGVFQGEGLLVVDPGTGAPVVTVAASGVLEVVPTIRAVRDGDGIVLQVSGDAEVERSARTIEDALRAFGDRYAAAAGVPSLRPAPTIWCSWYHYFTAVTESDMSENVDAVAELDLPVDVVQLDDGYQSEIGDWLTLSDRFRSLTDVVRRVADTGRRTGIWIAPFLAGARSTLAAEHPDWLLRADRDADPLVAIANWHQDVHALDTTHPGVQHYLREVFGNFRDVGIDFFKIDFIYAGALDGRRAEDVAPVAAYRAALDLIHESIGEAYLLGCGAPILPSVGKVDAMRISADTAPHWEPLEGDLAKPGGRAAVLSGEARAWQHGRFWVNDPDCLVVRPAVERREALAEHVRRVGGLRGSSDRIADLDEWGLDVTRELLSSAPAPTPFA